MRAACVAAMLGTVALGQQRVHAVVGSAESGDGFPRESGRSEKARAFRNYVGLQKRLRGSPKRSGQGLPKGSGRSERATVDYTAEWGAYKEKYGKVYSEQVDRVRFGVFVKNLEYIARENIRGHTYELGVNGYADMTADEFSSAYMRAWEWKRPNATWGDLPHLGTHVYSGAPLSRSVDWTERGAVTRVKNQGKCGSSWAFSTTGALEGAWKIETGKLASFNEQLLVNCDCEKGVCTVDIPPGPVVGFKDVQQDSEESMMEAVSRQPVSVAIKVETSAFQFYKRGVLTACGDGPSHGVLVVGYGTSENGVNYWKVKNSWGPQWGMSGYVRILRGEKRGAGKCGIPSGSPSFPVVEAGPRRPGPGGVAAALLKARAAAAVAALLEDSQAPPAPLAPSLGLRRGRPGQPGQLAGAHHAVSEPVIVDDGAPAPPTPSQLAGAHHVVSEPIVDDGAPAPPAPLAPSQLDGAHHDVSEPAILDDGATEDKVADEATEHGRARPNTAELLALIL